MRQARFKFPVHRDAAAIHFDADAVGEQAVAVSTAADGAEHRFAGDGLLRFLAGEVYGKVLARLLHALYHRVREDLHALLFRMSARFCPSSLSMFGSRRSMPSMTVTAQPRSA